MTTKITLQAMKFYAYHGVLEQERRVGNTFVVDLTLTAPLEKAVQSDQLEDTINYAEVYELTKQEMNIPSQLLEHVAGRICRALRHHFPQIEQIEIRVSKLNPPFGGDVHSASVLLID
ncbi:MAG: dihydroneopterin aldolase [Parabacteroides sp.]|nr:dihydroneopterin aldolase [Parabacteroides sp.]MDD6100875.1 dihydroneopterin aldolase [bacterium]MDD6749996.1 dihydroneopterin aldolase [bacterium]MDD7633285.1 dihydroneopterin aldolase [bacterium]MDD7721559.1 dihydroneopterin aldolase [bacterium]